MATYTDIDLQTILDTAISINQQGLLASDRTGYYNTIRAAIDNGTPTGNDALDQSIAYWLDAQHLLAQAAPVNETKPLTGFWATVAGFFSAMWNSTGGTFIKGFQTILDPKHGYFAPQSGIDTIQSLLNMHAINEDGARYLREWTKDVNGRGTVLNIGLSLASIISVLQMLFKIMPTELVKSMNTVFRPMLADPASIIGAAFIDPPAGAKVREELRESGYSEQQIDLMYTSQYRMRDIILLRDLTFRGIITRDVARKELLQQGFTARRADDIMAGWNVIPGIQDLLFLVAKEAFEPDQIALMGLDKEFPEEQSQWLTKQGLERYWQEKYWAAHWQQPSWEQVIAMLHRGLITQDVVDAFYRTVEIPQYWREKLTAIQYVPYTRVDARRMLKMGFITIEQAKQDYLWAGYDDEHASNMAAFALHEAQSGVKDIAQSKVEKAYRDGILPNAQAMDLLKQLGYDDNGAQFILALVDADNEKELQDAIVDSTKQSYIDNVIDDVHARSVLNTLQLSATKIDALIMLWTTKRTHGQKYPTKADMDAFFSGGIIDEQVYRAELHRIGYADHYIDWYVQLITTPK